LPTLKNIVCIIKTIFFGNYFYGICVVLLSMETSLRLHIPLLSWSYYCLLFLSTILYYTYAYTNAQNNLSFNARSKWYRTHNKKIKHTQVIYILLSILLLFFICYVNWITICKISINAFSLLFLFPVIALLYYGVENNYYKKINLRNIGWLKPFAISIVWSGVVTIYPMLMYSIFYKQPFIFTNDIIFSFTTNILFITVLCIMFDMKDYALDSNEQLKTFVVKIGLRKTIYYILLPLLFIGILLQLYYSLYEKMYLDYILINITPFLYLSIISFFLQKTKSILFYLIIIDGMMVVKALLAIIFIKV
jgi:hypothetical protein